MNKLVLSSILAGLFWVSSSAQATSTPWYESWLNRLDTRYSFVNDRLLNVNSIRDNYVERIDVLNEQLAEFEEAGKTNRVRILTRRIDVYERLIVNTDRNIARLSSTLDYIEAKIDRVCHFFPPGATGGGLCSASGG